MSRGYNGATHFSIVWAATLAIITLVEWRNLEQDPLERQILSPFIQREITVSIEEPRSGDEIGGSTGTHTKNNTSDVDSLQYEVAFHFNGPLFLLCFFAPILLFHGLGLLWIRFRDTR